MTPIKKMTKNNFGTADDIKSFSPESKEKFKTVREQLSPGTWMNKNPDRKDSVSNTKVVSETLQPLKSGDSMSDILSKLYNFVKKSYDDELKRNQIANNFKEEEQLEEERRHKKLISSLYTNKATPLKEPEREQKGNLFDTLKDFFMGKTLLDILMQPLTFLGNHLKKMVGPLMRVLSGAVVGLVRLLGPAALAAAVATGIAHFFRYKTLDKTNEADMVTSYKTLPGTERIYDEKGNIKETETKGKATKFNGKQGGYTEETFKDLTSGEKQLYRINIPDMGTTIDLPLTLEEAKKLKSDYGNVAGYKRAYEDVVNKEPDSPEKDNKLEQIKQGASKSLGDIYDVTLGVMKTRYKSGVWSKDLISTIEEKAGKREERGFFEKVKDRYEEYEQVPGDNIIKKNYAGTEVEGKVVWAWDTFKAGSIEGRRRIEDANLGESKVGKAVKNIVKPEKQSDEKMSSAPETPVPKKESTASRLWKETKEQYNIGKESAEPIKAPKLKLDQPEKKTPELNQLPAPSRGAELTGAIKEQSDLKLDTVTPEGKPAMINNTVNNVSSLPGKTSISYNSPMYDEDDTLNSIIRGSMGRNFV